MINTAIPPMPRNQKKPVIEPQQPHPLDIWCADVDSDGSTDIAVAALSDAISWWRNIGRKLTVRSGLGT